MLNKEDKVIIAVSGGIDSVTMLDILYKISGDYKLSLLVAHVNHGLRGEESLRDENFVNKLASEYGLPFERRVLDKKDFESIKGLSIQEKARALRYEFFYKLMNTVVADKIATGHTMDDQAETLLLRLIKGTGISGLSGIPSKRDYIIRPLIELTREEIILYAKYAKLKYVEDSSNIQEKYLRNKIRMELIPLLKKEYNPNIIKRLSSTSLIFQDDDDYLKKESERILNEVSEYKGEEIIFKLDEFKKLPLSLKRMLLRLAVKKIKGDIKDLGFDHIESILNLICSELPNKEISLPSRIRVIREYNKFRIIKDVKATQDFIKELAIPGKTFIKEICKNVVTEIISHEHIEKLDPKNQDVAFLDYNLITNPVIVRNFRRGDRFNPYGMEGSKKLKDFFIEKKIPKSIRMTIPIFTMGQKIIWVGGFRINHEFKIGKETKKILKITLS